MIDRKFSKTEALLWFTLIVDLVLTRVLYGTAQASEANPVAEIIISQLGWWGAAAVAIASTGVVVGVCQYVYLKGHRRTAAGGILAAAGINVAVVIANLRSLWLSPPDTILLKPVVIYAVGLLAAVTLIWWRINPRKLPMPSKQVRRSTILGLVVMGSVVAPFILLGNEYGDNAVGVVLASTSEVSDDFEDGTADGFSGSYSIVNSGYYGDKSLEVTGTATAERTDVDVNSSDFLLNYTVKYDSVADGWVGVRNGSQDDRIRLEADPDNNNWNLQLYDDSTGSTETRTFSSPTPSTGTWYHVKIQGTIDAGKKTIKVKVWEAGTSEPSSWTVSEDTTVDFTGGDIYLNGPFSATDIDMGQYILSGDQGTTYTASGSVSLHDGSACTGCEVTIYDGTDTSGTVVDTISTDTNGNYSVSLTKGTYTAEVTETGYTHPSETFEITDSSVSGIDLLVSRNQAPWVSSATPRNNVYVSDRTVSLSATIKDTDDSGNISATIWYYKDGNWVNKTHVSNAKSGVTLSTTVNSASAGQNKWKVETSDGVNSANSTFRWRAPGKIYVWNGSEGAGSLEKGDLNVSITTIGLQSDYRDNRVISDGVVDLEGIPGPKSTGSTGSAVIVDVSDPDGLFYNATATLDYPWETSYILLQPKSANALNNDGDSSTDGGDALSGGNETVEQGFTLQDNTGNYPASSTKLIVSQYYNGAWRVVESEYFGSANLATIILKNGTTYRLQVQNDQGDTRSLGQLNYDAANYPDPITLTIESTNDGDVDDETEPPVAEFGYSPEAPKATETMTFDGSNSTDPDGQIVSYEWDIYDDNTTELTGSKVTYTFNSGGNYTVALTVTDDDGNSDTITETFYVASQNEPPVAVIDANVTSVASGDTVEWNASNSTDPDGSIDLYAWDTDGDGTTDANSVSTTQTYVTKQLYNVSLEVSDNDGASDTAVWRINVTDTGDQFPVPDFTWTPTNPDAGQSTKFNASASSDNNGITKYQWDFDDDGTFEKTGKTANWSYSTNGTYDVTLRVTDSSDQFNETVQTVTVGAGEPTADPNKPPTADFSVSPSNPDPGQLATLNASKSSDPDGNVTKYQWDLDNDGNYEKTGKTVKNAWGTAGKYQVTLKVTDNMSTTDTVTKVVTVGSGDKLESGYTWDAVWVDANTSDDSASIEFSFVSGTSTDVSDFELRLYPVGEPNNDTTYNFGIVDSVFHTEPLVGNETETRWVVEWNATIDGSDESGRMIVGPRATAGGAIPFFWRQVFAVGIMLVLGGAFGGIIRAEIGAAVMALVGAVFFELGWLPAAVGGGAIAFALVVSGASYMLRARAQT